jgi:uncharacterized cupin superfamily protein
MPNEICTAIAASSIPERIGSRYPQPYDAPCAGRSNRSLGDAFGLQQFGVQLLTLNPGAWSSQRHWHTSEDELIYVLEGTPTLISERGETQLAPGSVAAFPAGAANGHHIVNMAQSAARLLVVGSRIADDDVFYPDIDMRILKRAKGGQYERGNGDAID